MPQGSYGAGFGFTGEYTDANDLLYLRARYYAPEMGVFTALDPFEGISQRPMSLNGYSWVEGNVINAVDPSGKNLILSMLMNSGGCDSQQQLDPEPTPNCESFTCCLYRCSGNTSTEFGICMDECHSEYTNTPARVLYFGGSALGPDLDTTNIKYSDSVVLETNFSFIEGQAPHLFAVADYAIPYPGTNDPGPNGEKGKELQALNASNNVPLGTKAISLGYSAGADAALIFTYRYRSNYNMVGVGILGGSLDGGIRNDDGTIPVNDIYPGIEGTNIDWQQIVRELLASQIRVYILDDNVVAPDFSGFVAAQQSNQYLCYDNQPTLQHFLEMNSGTDSTNRDSSVPINALAFLRDGDRSRCS